MWPLGLMALTVMGAAWVAARLVRHWVRALNRPKGPQ
jgi:hypothetical protein